MADGEVIIRTKLDTDDLEKNAKSAKKTVEDLASGMENAGKQSEVMDSGLAKITKSLTSLEKIAKSSFIMKIAKVAIKALSSINEETSVVVEKLRGASTLYGDVAVDQEQLLQNLYSISAATGESVENLGQAVYEAMSSGVEATSDMGDVLNVVSSSAKLASGGFTDTATALSATLTVINAYKLGLEDLDSVQSMLLQTQNLGVTTVGELGDALANVTPTAASFGVKFADIATAVSLMTKQGTKTRVATTALAQVISELGKSGTTAAENLAEAARDAGLTETSFTGLIDEGYSLGQILQIISDYATKNGKSMVDMFSSVEAGRATLQLVGDNAEDFNTILEEMEKSTGLVQTSFEKTVDPMDQLSESWSNLQSKIGTKLLPLQQGFATAATAVINKLVGQEVSADDLSSALETLEGSSKAVKKAQEDMKTSLDETTQSSYFEGVTALYTAIGQVATSYDKAKAQLQKYEKEEASATRVLSGNYEQLNKAMKTTGLTSEQLYEKYILWEQGVLDLSEIFQKGTETEKELMIEAVGYFMEAEEKAEAAKEKVAGFQETVNGYVEALATIVAEGGVSIETIALYSKGLAAEVEAALTKIEKKTESTSGKAEEGSKKVTTALTDEEKQVQEMEKAYDEIIKSYENTLNVKDALGEAIATEEDRTKDLNDLYKELVGKYGESSAACVQLKKKIDDLNGTVEDGTEAWEEFKDACFDALRSAGSQLAQGFGSAIEEAVYQLVTLKDQLAEIDEQIADVAEDERKALESVETAQASLDTAKARGNHAAIKAAEEELEQAQDKVKALQKEKQALEKTRESTANTSEAWKAAGKVALESLASVLEALGAELAAQAVVKAISYQWATAAIATAGSVAAYAAAGLVKGWASKFEQGGIVPGNSKHGDQVLARVNSGELILNAAQQENLARIIEASAVLAQSTGQGAGIHVHFDGVSFYGLDEASVGKAIYENIQNLKYEGVI